MQEPQGGAYRYDPDTDRIIPDTGQEPVKPEPVTPEPTERTPK